MTTGVSATRAGAAALVLGAVLASAPLHGQTVRGRVVDDVELVPVYDARIVLVRPETPADSGVANMVDVGSAVTDSAGYFRIEAPGGGRYRLRAERIGYATTLSQPFRVGDVEIVTVEFWLQPDAVLLDPVIVTARSSRGRSEFHRRMEEWGRGLFVTPEMVDSLDPVHPAHLLEGLDEVKVEWETGYTSTGERTLVPDVKTELGRGCMAYSVDGRRATTAPWDPSNPWTLFPLDGVRADDVVAVEVYRSLYEAPPELRNAASRMVPDAHPATNPVSGTTRQWALDEYACGITVFWTRQGW